MHSSKTPRISKGGPTGPTGPTLFLTLSYRPTRHCTHAGVVKNMSSPTEEIGNQWDHRDQWDHLSEIKRLGDAQSKSILGPYWDRAEPSGTAARAGGGPSHDASPAGTDRGPAYLRSLS
jgi:hypothetical protein